VGGGADRGCRVSAGGRMDGGRTCQTVVREARSHGLKVAFSANLPPFLQFLSLQRPDHLQLTRSTLRKPPVTRVLAKQFMRPIARSRDGAASPRLVCQITPRLSPRLSENVVLESVIAPIG